MIIGTTNPGKVREIAAICRPYDIELTTLQLDVDETGETFAANAEIKARAYSRRNRGQTVLVEDSGLSVGILDGLPGPWSARFTDLDLATKKVRPSSRLRLDTDHLNNLRVLELLKGIPLSDRGASFTVHMILMRDQEILFRTENQSHGWIAEECRGSEGFGYDPIFVGNNTFDRTYGELDAARKNLCSHRKEALREFSVWLAKAVMQGEKL